MKISAEAHKKNAELLAGLEAERNDWLPFWRELADYLLPKRYVWLEDPKNRRTTARNSLILDSTGTTSARTLAAGMMNGITSPSRPWFKLRLKNIQRKPLNSDDAWDGTTTYAERKWLDEVERRMMTVLAESNFYNSMATVYLDLVIFATAGMLIYEDYDDVIRCYNPAIGEFGLGQSSGLYVDLFYRKFKYSLRQMIERWGEENLTEQLRMNAKQGGAALLTQYTIFHLIRPNTDNLVPKKFKYVEIYWMSGATSGEVLEAKGFNECPGIFPRWETVANDVYGSICPAIEALPDIIQLQHETLAKGTSLDTMNQPPMILDARLKNQPTALLPRGKTFVPSTSEIGAKPAYQIQPPIAEMTADILDVRQRIREIFHNDLFKMISQLDTVRTATEIDARREEKLVLMGSVLERFESEALDPALKRIYSIMERKGLLPEPPESIAGNDLEIQYVSILTSAQRAVGVAPIERWVQLVGNLSAAAPKVLNVPDFENLVRIYGRDIGVPASCMVSPEDAKNASAQQDELVAQREAASQGSALAQGAKTLSETDVGGGANALQQLLGS